MAFVIQNLLLLALPASGKSELRRYIDHLPTNVRSTELHLGEPVHLDDYPYVHLMRRVSEEMTALGEQPLFFAAPQESFLDHADWGTLIELVSEDWAALTTRPPCVDHPGEWLLDRLDRARARTGASAGYAELDTDLQRALADTINDDAAALVEELSAGRPLDLDGRTVVIEFARGGPEGAEAPLPAPFGYQHSLSLLPAGLTRRAAALYVWVTPEESRKRNRERAKPGPEGDASILHHGVPESVMRNDYGTDDMAWLLRTARRPGTISVAGAGGTADVPAVVFDNRDDLTSYLRGEPDTWPADAVSSLRERLGAAMDRLWMEITGE